MFPSYMKLITCFSFAGVSFGIPLSYGFGTNNSEVSRHVFKKIGDIALSTVDKGGSLSLKNLEDILEKIKERGQTVDFKEVGMKFGEISLEKDDILISPAQNGRYYLAKFAGKFNKYKLSNGKFLQTLNEHDPAYKDLDYVDLDWKPFYRQRKLLTIAVGSCKFTRLNPYSLRIRCHEFFNGRNGFGEITQGVLTFGEQDNQLKNNQIV